MFSLSSLFHEGIMIFSSGYQPVLSSGTRMQLHMEALSLRDKNTRQTDRRRETSGDIKEFSAFTKNMWKDTSAQINFRSGFFLFSGMLSIFKIHWRLLICSFSSFFFHVTVRPWFLCNDTVIGLLYKHKIRKHISWLTILMKCIIMTTLQHKARQCPYSP